MAAEAMRHLFDVRGKRVIVSGGSSGIGKMIVEGLMQLGAEVLTFSRKMSSSFADEMNALGHAGTCFATRADVTSDEDLQRLHNYAQEIFEGQADVLINNSGTNFAASMEEYSREAFAKVLEVNLTSVFGTTRALLPLLKQAATADCPARVINIGSIDGIRVSPIEHYAYGASKAGLHHLTMVMAGFLGKHHITVNTIAAGAFRTKMMAATLARMEDAIKQAATLKRIGEKEDIVGTVVWLCSKAGAFVTGATIVLDGGVLCRSRI